MYFAFNEISVKYSEIKKKSSVSNIFSILAYSKEKIKVQFRESSCILPSQVFLMKSSRSFLDSSLASLFKMPVFSQVQK